MPGKSTSQPNKKMMVVAVTSGGSAHTATKKKKKTPSSSSSTSKKTTKKSTGSTSTTKKSTPKKSRTTKKSSKQSGGATPVCSGSYKPSKLGEPAIISGVASRGSTNAYFPSTTPTADLTPISFDKMYSVYPMSAYPPISTPLPLRQGGSGCGCAFKK